jgi:hypothetical protein
LPDAASLAALRAWYEGMPSREAVERFLAGRRAAGESSRGILGRIREQVVMFAHARHRGDIAAMFEQARSRGARRAKAVAQALETLKSLPDPEPLLGDDVERWLAPRAAAALRAAGIKTLADLTVRVPRRRRWWAGIAGLGARGAQGIEAFFAAHPQLTERARALVAVAAPEDIAPWERIVVPHEVDGSRWAPCSAG